MVKSFAIIASFSSMTAKFFLGFDMCPVLFVHWLDNYDDCNKPNSYLHKLIPRDKEGFNKRCRACTIHNDPPRKPDVSYKVVAED